MQNYYKQFPVVEKRFKNRITLGMVCLLLLGVVSPASAQMFSVGEYGPNYNQPMSEVYLGLEAMKATYKGDPNLDGAGAFEYEGPVARIGYNTPGFNFSLNAGGNVTGVDDASYFDVGGNFDFGINLYRDKSLWLKLPIRLISRYTNITNNQGVVFPTVNRFQFGMLAAGIGVQGMARIQENIRIKMGAVPGYGFSFATGGFFGGSVGTINAAGKLYLDRLFGDKGLSLGYSYDLRGYDVEEDVYDYRLNGHTIELGITF